MKKTAKRKSVVKILPKIKFSFLLLIFVLIAVTGVVVYLVINNNPAKNPKAATPLNTVDLIVSDMTLPHMGCVKGTGYYDWEKGPVVQKAGPGSNNSTSGWAMLDWDCNHDSGSLNTQIEVRGYGTYALANGKWSQINNSIYGSQINDPNFGSAIYGDGGKGPLFLLPHNRGIQFYGPQETIPGGTTGVYTTYQARLVLIDPAKTDDIDSAFILANAGADWFTSYTNTGGAGVGRLKKLTRDWQAINFTTVPETALRATPPPGLDVLVTPTPQSTPQPIVTCTQVDFDRDGKISILDLARMSKSNGARVGDPKYKDMYDLNKDGVINTLDYSMAATFFAKKC